MYDTLLCSIEYKEIEMRKLLIDFIARKIMPIGLNIVLIFTPSYSQANNSNDQKTLTLQSSSFNDNGSIPTKFTCVGDNISPPLTWQNAPKNTKSFVLIVDDPDASKEPWVHWILFNIPNNSYALSENLATPPSGSQYGKNSWSKSSYDGPCPPSGEHHYVFKLYALDTVLNLSSNADKSQIESAMQNHILASAQLTGRYKK